MHVYEVMAHPIRRRLVEILALGPHPTWMLCDCVVQEFRVARTTVHHHLRLLRAAGFVWLRWEPVSLVDPRRQNHEYSLRVEVLERLDTELERLRALWQLRLDHGDAADPERRMPELAPR
ncbi:MAG: helix-turn-helix domain-containing protein [Actinomycetales bacterium]|nr:helix-turn-helix domain-containing protein [Actinomycetales bacterium]